MHGDGYEKAKDIPHQPFAPGAESEMFSFQLSRQPLADHMVSRSQVPLRGTPAISEELQNN